MDRNEVIYKQTGINKATCTLIMSLFINFLFFHQSNQKRVLYVQVYYGTRRRPNQNKISSLCGTKNCIIYIASKSCG
jgi:hypothetical protein